MIWGMFTPLKVSISSWKRKVVGKRKRMKVEREREGWKNAKFRGTLFLIIFGEKRITVHFHLEIWFTAPSWWPENVGLSVNCYALKSAHVSLLKWKHVPGGYIRVTRKSAEESGREVQQSSGHYPDSLDVWVQLQAGWYPDASPRSLLSLSLPLNLKKGRVDLHKPVNIW